MIVDSSVWIDYLRGTPNAHVEWLDREANRQLIGLTDSIYCEVLQGVLNDSAFETVKNTLQRFTILSTGGRILAEATARNYRYLRARGTTVRSTIDCLVATTCLEHDYALLHRDRDYDAFESFLGLQVIEPVSA